MFNGSSRMCQQSTPWRVIGTQIDLSPLQGISTYNGCSQFWCLEMERTHLFHNNRINSNDHSSWISGINDLCCFSTIEWRTWEGQILNFLPCILIHYWLHIVCVFADQNGGAFQEDWLQDKEIWCEECWIQSLVCRNADKWMLIIINY